MTNYEKGRRGEYEVKAMLEKQGWQVYRTAGSHSAVDLVCLRDGNKPLLIQVKRGRKPTQADWKKLEDVPLNVLDFKRGIIYREDGGKWLWWT